jgi:hypothetical protein
MEEQLKYGIDLRTHDVPEMVFKARCERAAGGKNRYPIHRRTRFGARVELGALMDAIALDPSWRAERIHASYIVMDGEGMFATGWGSRKADYCSCTFHIHARDIATAEAARDRILRRRRLRASPSRCSRSTGTSSRAPRWRARRSRRSPMARCWTRRIRS